MDKYHCRICQSTKLDLELRYEKAPRNIERLLNSVPTNGDNAVELKVYKCQTCGHIQLTEQLVDDYYEDYLMTHSHAKKMQEFIAKMNLPKTTYAQREKIYRAHLKKKYGKNIS